MLACGPKPMRAPVIILDDFAGRAAAEELLRHALAHESAFQPSKVSLGHGGVFLAAPYVELETGLIVNPLTVHPWEAILLPGLVVLASLVGFLPGLSAYRTDVARVLAE